MTRVRRGAIVGFGAVAEHGHLPGWRADPRFEIVAVAEPRSERRAAAQRALPDARCYASLLELLAAEQVDFVDVAAPPLFHADAIVAAANAGVHVLCEKPLVTNREEFERACRAVRAAGVVLHPVHNWKFAEAYRILSELTSAESTSIGPPREMLFRVERDGWSVSDGDWRAERRLAGGGILVDHGWHAFYLALGLAHAEPIAVSAVVEKCRYESADVEDTARCEIDFGTCRARIDLTWAGCRRATVWEVEGRDGSAAVHDAALYVCRDGSETAQQLGSSLSAGSHHAEWFPGVIESFVRALEEPASASNALIEAGWCVALTEAAYASSAADGRRTTVEPPMR